jgi:hypothetical protein
LLHELLLAARIENRANRLVDQLFVVQRIVVSGRVRELLIAGPEIGHDLGVLARWRNLDLGAAHEVGQARDGQFLRPGARDDIDVRRERFFEPITGRQSQARDRESGNGTRAH